VDLKNKRVLVTGADGFIGSHLVEELVRKGCSVRAFVFYNSFGSWGWLDNSKVKTAIEVFAGDVRDPHGIKASMKGCDAVFHLAALIGIPYSYHSPDNYVDTNIRGTLNVLQAARELCVERIVHTSTSEVYGTAQFVPITEEHPINPQSPYAATKSAADFLSLSFYRSFNLPVSIVRPFNTFGPRQSARAIIPTIISQILLKGNKVLLGSLNPTRDLNFVLDTVDGFLRAGEADNALGEVINIGSGYDISVGDLAKKIGEIMNIKIEISEDSQRIRPDKSEVGRLCAGNQKAYKLLQWEPKYSLDEGLIKTIEWFQKSKNLSLYKSNIYNI